MDISIRKIIQKDKDRLLEMMTEFYNSPALLHHTPENILSRVIDDCISDTPYIEGYVAVKDGTEILGYTMLSVGYSTEYGGISVMIEDLYVTPNARGNRLGERLLNFVSEIYKNKAVRVRLEVTPDNDRAQKLYERCGFTEIRYKQMGKIL